MMYFYPFCYTIMTKKTCSPAGMISHYFAGVSTQDKAISIFRIIFGLAVAFMFGFAKLT